MSVAGSQSRTLTTTLVPAANLVQAYTKYKSSLGQSAPYLETGSEDNLAWSDLPGSNAYVLCPLPYGWLFERDTSAGATGVLRGWHFFSPRLRGHRAPGNEK